jgi:hypothetical protein
MSVAPFIAGALTVTGASIVQGVFAYALDRRRSSDSRGISEADQHLTARTAYRLVSAEIAFNQTILTTCEQQERWWPITIPPRFADWNTYRDVMARHLASGELLHQLAVAYSDVEIMVSIREPRVGSPSLGADLGDTGRAAVNETLDEFNACARDLALLTG